MVARYEAWGKARKTTFRAYMRHQPRGWKLGRWCATGTKTKAAQIPSTRINVASGCCFTSVQKQWNWQTYHLQPIIYIFELIY
jgi:hypothetical protein